MHMGPSHPAFGMPGGGMRGPPGMPGGPGMRWDPIAPQGLPGFHPDDFARGAGHMCVTSLDAGSCLQRLPKKAM
jgi:hypothetical protein